jgi:hypothetical protein
MANNCYNTYTFLGNAKVLKQAKEWKLALDKVVATPDDPECMRAIREVFYPNDDDDEIDIGSSWAHQDDDSIGSGEGQLGFISAWSPPNELHKRMACLLYALDKHVVIQNNFHVEDGSMGVSYASPHDAKNAYLQEAMVEVDEDDFEDIEEAEEDAQERLAEMELEILDFFMDDMQGTSKVIKKHMPHLDLDWDAYK